MTDTATPSPTPSVPAPKKRSWGRLILKACAVLLILFIVVLISLYFARNYLVRVGVERGGAFATNQTTTLESANLGLGSGSLELTGLNIANPSGYTPNSQLLIMKDCKVTVETGSLLSDTVSVPAIEIDGLEITLEQNGLNNNLTDILAIVQTKTAPAASPSGSSSPSSSSAASPQGKKLNIKVIRLKNTIVHIKPLAGLGPITLHLGDIEMPEPTNADGRPMRIADVVGKVLINVATSIANDPQVPAVFKNSLGQATKAINDLTKNLGKGLGGAGAGLQKGVQDIGKNLGGLFGQPTTQK